MAREQPQPCVVCEEPVKFGSDVAVRIEDGERDGWAHVTCTRHGVERWCRHNRPFGDPLTWERTVKPAWRTHQFGRDRTVRGPSQRLLRREA